MVKTVRTQPEGTISELQDGLQYTQLDVFEGQGM